MKKVSSIVWQFFDRLKENDRCVAVLCRLCGTKYKYCSNTTNLRTHLIKKHPIQWEQHNWDKHKLLDELNLLGSGDDESDTQSTFSAKRKKYTKTHKDKNVVYVKEDIAGETDNEDNEAAYNLLHQMHDDGFEEEWLEVDNPNEMYRLNQHHTKIKRNAVTPTINAHYVVSNNVSPEKNGTIVTEDDRKDEYSIFGEYISNSLRKFKSPRTRANLQQVTSVLWQAEYGMYDEADAVRQIMSCKLPISKLEQSSKVNGPDKVSVQMKEVSKGQEESK